MSEARLYADLAALGVAWSSLEHEAVFTVEESEAIHAALPGAHTKNLFLKNADGSFWLVTVDHAKRVDLKGLAGAVGAKKFSFGKPEDMERLLGVTPGAVTPLAVINADLVDAERVHVHPLRNTATIGLSGGDLLRALEGWNHSAIVSGIPERP